MNQEHVHNLGSAIAEDYCISFLGSSDGSLTLEADIPYPWLSLYPNDLEKYPERFLVLLAHIGEWNNKNLGAQWIIRPMAAPNTSEFSTYYILEPRMRNLDRNEATLALLLSHVDALAEHLRKASSRRIAVRNL